MIPDCSLGYTDAQLRRILGDEDRNRFCAFMHRRPSPVCPEHGVTVAAEDVARFLLRDAGADATIGN
jgi:hypothetical protein